MYIYSKSMILDILAKYIMVILWLSYGYPVVRYAELMLIVYWHPRPLYKGRNGGRGRRMGRRMPALTVTGLQWTKGEGNKIALK